MPVMDSFVVYAFDSIATMKNPLHRDGNENMQQIEPYTCRSFSSLHSCVPFPSIRATENTIYSRNASSDDGWIEYIAAAHDSLQMIFSLAPSILNSRPSPMLL